MKINFLFFFKNIIVILLTLQMVGCASDKVTHGIEYNARRDSPEIKILEISYGTEKHTVFEFPVNTSKYAKVNQAWGTYGFVYKGDLYIKWKVKATNKIYKKKINLNDRIPTFSKMYTIYIIVRNEQVYVYYISNTNLSKSRCEEERKERKLAEITDPDERIKYMYCSKLISRLYPEELDNIFTGR